MRQQTRDGSRPAQIETLNDNPYRNLLFKLTGLCASLNLLNNNLLCKIGVPKSEFRPGLKLFDYSYETTIFEQRRN